MKYRLTKGNVDARDEKGNAPLILASSKRKWEMSATLLNRGALVNIQNIFGWTTLHVATFNGCVKVFTLLLENNACVNEQNKDGASLLSIAEQEGHVHACTLLLGNNAQVNQEIKKVHLPCLLQHRMVIFTYAPYYFRTTRMLIKK